MQQVQDSGNTTTTTTTTSLNTKEIAPNGPVTLTSSMRWRRLVFKKHGPTARSGHAANVLDNKMIIFGGSSKQTDHIFLVDIENLQCSDISTEDTLSVSPISSFEKAHRTYRVGHSAVTLDHNRSLYIFGGWNDQEYLDYGLLLNLSTLRLVVEQTKNRKRPQPRRDHTLVKMGPYLLLFGGWSHVYNNGNDLWCLDSSWKWQCLEVNGVPPSPRRGHSAVVIGSRMYIFGGLYGFSKYLNDIHIYDGDTNTWSKPPSINKGNGSIFHMPCPRAWHTATSIGHSQMLIYGGTSGRLDFYSDVWIYNIPQNSWFQVQTNGITPSPRCGHTMVKVFYDKQFFDEVFQGREEKEMSNGNNNSNNNNNNNNNNINSTKKVRIRLLIFGGLTPYEVNRNELPEKARKTILLRANQSFKRLRSAMSASQLSDLSEDGSDIDSDEDQQSNEDRHSKGDDEKEKDILSGLSKQIMSREKSDGKTNHKEKHEKKKDDDNDEITEINKIEPSDELFELSLEM